MTSITRVRGDTYPHQVLIRRKADRSLAELTGSIVTWSVSADRESGLPSYLFQTQGIVSNSFTGQVDFIFDELKANNLGTYYYDMQISSAGEIRTIDRGTITFKQDITKVFYLLVDDIGDFIVDEASNNITGHEYG